MSAVAPAVIGYEVEKAREICEAAGLAVGEVMRVGPPDDSCEGSRKIVVRQRIGDGGDVELTVSCVWVAPEQRAE